MAVWMVVSGLGGAMLALLVWVARQSWQISRLETELAMLAAVSAAYRRSAGCRFPVGWGEAEFAEGDIEDPGKGSV